VWTVGLIGRYLLELGPLVPVGDGHVGVLQAGPAHLQVGHLVAVLGKQLADEAGGVRGGVHEALAVAAPAHLGLAGDPPGELVGAAVGHDPPLGQDEDAVGQLLGLGQVVGGEQDGGVLQVGQAVHQVVEVPPRPWVEPGGRLVEEQQLGPAHQADGDVQAAALPPGQGGEPLAGLLGEPHRLEQRVDVAGSRPLGRGVGGVVAAEVGQEVAHPPAPVVAPGLQDHADPGPPPLVAPGRVDAEHADLAGRAHPEPLQDLDGGGLAGAVRPEQRDHLAAADVEVDPGEHVPRPVAHAQATDVDHRIGHSSTTTTLSTSTARGGGGRPGTPGSAARPG